MDQKINYDPIFPTDLSLDLAHLDVAMPGVDDAFHHTSILITNHQRRIFPEAKSNI